jgi:peptide chain release factor 2|tara:strand:- start:670 stop:1608 length:939 start_codon:yes stop_codon:yes gene_type:complete
VSQELSNLKTEIESYQVLEREFNDLKELSVLGIKDESIQPELQERIRAFKKNLEEGEIKVFLSGKYDKGNALLSIYSGAGGQDAQDWAAILLRMYERYCLKKGFRAKVLHQTFGEAGGPEGRIGIKSVTLEVKGNYVYGFLRKENGVHRLVRISPFSAQKLRHTSFALVEVLPEINQGAEKINPQNLKIDTFRASGPGGQYVNRRESAVRITHLPSGIVVASQAERLQGLNKEKAMKMLYGKLYQLKEKEKEKEIKKIKGKPTSIEWGSQIRSYVLHPYKLVKDVRTNVETSKVEAVLDGDLNEFIEAEIKQ